MFASASNRVIAGKCPEQPFLRTLFLYEASQVIVTSRGYNKSAAHRADATVNRWVESLML